LATVTPSLVTVGEPNFFVDDDVAALGPEGDLHRAREELDAAKDLLTSALVEQQLFSSHVIFLVSN
jgi:hypothetical protein